MEKTEHRPVSAKGAEHRRVTFDMVDHGGIFGTWNPGEFRFRVKEAIFNDGTLDTSKTNSLSDDRTLKWLKKRGVEIRIVQKGTYPAPPGLRKCVVR